MNDADEILENRKKVLSAFLQAKAEAEVLEVENKKLKEENELLLQKLEDKNTAYQNLFSFVQNNK